MKKLHKYKIGCDHFIIIYQNGEYRSIALYKNGDSKSPLSGGIIKSGDKNYYIDKGKELLGSYIKNKDNGIFI